MSLRILFADDSVTAQNMGKKILTDAGYDVVAVSNGAAAVKKIAEQKPDIIILDLYMPGYTGLEVCEKVRSSIATIKTPVLLTVGKMEPYKPEDANRVRADGVIIKPFEASDLLAIVKKFEERIGQMPPAPQAAAPSPQPSMPVQEMAVEPEHHPEPPAAAGQQSTVEVPDHMATSSAFSDLLGTEAPAAVEQFRVPQGTRVPTLPEPATHAAAVPDYDLPVSWRQEAEPQPTIVAPPVPIAVAPPAPPIIAPPPEAVAPPVTVPAPRPSAPVTARPIQIPVYHEPELNHSEVVPTAAGPVGDIDIPREPALQETAEEVTRSTVADVREPGLVTSSNLAEEASHLAAQASSVQVAEVPSGATERMPAETETAAAAEPPLPEEHHPQPVASGPVVSDVDFEARVAAAMASYHHPQQVAATQPEMPQPVQAEIHAIPAETLRPVVTPAPAAAAAMKAAEPSSAIHLAPPPAAMAAPVVEAPQPGQAVAAPATAAVNHDAVAAKVEAELPAAAASVAQAAETSGADHENIAQAVARVMEKMKGDLVEEIVRELKGKK